MEIKDILPIKSEHTVKPDASFLQACKQFRRYNYLVVKEEDLFVGILTPEDAVKNLQAKYVYEALPIKPKLYIDSSLTESIYLFAHSRCSALPVFDKEKQYLVSLQLIDLLEFYKNRNTEPTNIIIQNAVGNEDLENLKYKFLQQIEHNTSNPIQVIYSALHLLELEQIKLNIDENERAEIECLQNAIYRSTKKIERFFKTFLEEFKNESKKLERGGHENPDHR